jgi:hypothetical protein
MATIERRLTELERTHPGYAGPLVVQVFDILSDPPVRRGPTPEQQAQIDEARKAGRLVVLLRRFCPPEPDSTWQ